MLQCNHSIASSFIRECGRTCRPPGVVFYLGWSDSWGHTANLLAGSYQVHRSGCYCKVERSWELEYCLFSVWLGERVYLLQVPPYFQSKAVVMCVVVTSLAGRFIQKISQKQIIWEYKGRLISPLHPTIHYMVQFKLVTSPCNLLIFPCQEVLASAVFTARGLGWQLSSDAETASVSPVSAEVVSADWFSWLTALEMLSDCDFSLGLLWVRYFYYQY